MAAATVAKVKNALRITHSLLDTNIQDTITACLEDLSLAGVVYPDETDPTILAAIKLYAASQPEYQDDPGKASACHQRYNEMKACIAMASGYRGDLNG